MASSRLPILIALAFSSLPFVLSHSNRVMWSQEFFPPNVCPINAKANTFYGIMFDAGSTGTRIHIYTFVQKSPGKTPMYADLSSNFSKQFCFLPAQHLEAAEDFYSLSFKWSLCRSLLSICHGVFLCKYFFVGLLSLRDIILGILENSKFSNIFIYAAVQKEYSTEIKRYLCWFCQVAHYLKFYQETLEFCIYLPHFVAN